MTHRSFTNIPDSKIDVDSPATEEVFTFLRDNDEYLKEKVDNALVFMAAPVEKFNGNPTTVFTDIDISADVVPEETDMDIEWFDDSTSTLFDKTTAARLNDASLTGAVMSDSADFLYIGADETFIKILVDLGVLAVGAGALTVEFFNGTAFAAATGVTDGTASGGNTFAQNGDITFTLPSTWAIGADAVQAGLDANFFYVRFKFQNTSGTPPNIDQAAPKNVTARIAIFQITLAATGTRATLRMRANGSAETSPQKLPTHTGDGQHRSQLFVPLTNEVCEYADTVSEEATTAIITLVGYLA